MHVFTTAARLQRVNYIVSPTDQCIQTCEKISLIAEVVIEIVTAMQIRLLKDFSRSLRGRGETW